MIEKAFLSGIISDAIRLGFNFAASQLSSPKIETPPYLKDIRHISHGKSEDLKVFTKELDKYIFEAKIALEKAKASTKCSYCVKSIEIIEEIIEEDILRKSKIMDIMEERELKSWMDLDDKTKEEIKKEVEKRR